MVASSPVVVAVDYPLAHPHRALNFPFPHYNSDCKLFDLADRMTTMLLQEMSCRHGDHEIAAMNLR